MIAYMMARHTRGTGMSTSQLSVYFFLQAGLIILACRLVGKLAQRIGQPQVVGEMIAGVLLGPSLFGAVLPDAQAALFPKATLDMLYAMRSALIAHRINPTTAAHATSEQNPNPQVSQRRAAS